MRTKSETNYKRSELIKWGIIGPGNIAHKFAEAIQYVEDAELYAVASRSQERANAFKKQYGATHAYDSYEKLVQNPEVDVIYIATTNNLHYKHAKLCLENGKACLVEKPFTLKLSELLELVSIARANNLFLMEALWTRFIPSIDRVSEEIEKGTIGEITKIEADFGFHVPYDKSSRLYAPELGGGALLDIGLYTIFFALHYLGLPDKISSTVQKTELGVDREEEITFEYPNKVQAKLKASFAQDLPCEATIFGTKGSIKFERMWHCPTLIKMYVDNKEFEITPEYISNGYNYEIEEVHNCLKGDKTESLLFPLESSINLLKTLEQIKALW